MNNIQPNQDETPGQARNRAAALKLLKFLKEDTPVSAKELIARTGFTAYRVQYALMWLKGQNLIKSRRGGHMLIKKVSLLNFVLSTTHKSTTHTRTLRRGL